jgi:transcription elongation factor Elf1
LARHHSAQAKAKNASKTKFTCPDCGQNAWAKPNALLICGSCYEGGDGDIVLMLAELRGRRRLKQPPTSFLM